jgi:hypothetical protein
MNATSWSQSLPNHSIISMSLRNLVITIRLTGRISPTVLTVFYFHKWMSFPKIYRCFTWSTWTSPICHSPSTFFSLFCTFLCERPATELHCTCKTIPSTLEAPPCMAFLHDEPLLIFCIQNFACANSQIHRVYCTYRMPGFLSSRPNWFPRPPHP